MKKLIIYVLLFACGKTFAQDTKVTITGGAIGGGSGNNIYNIDSSLSSDRTVDLNGSYLRFQEGGQNLLSINPVSFASDLHAKDGTAATDLILHGSVSAANFDLNTYDGTNSVEIYGDAIANTIDYTAATQTAIVSSLFRVTDNVQPLLEVDVTNHASTLRTYDTPTSSEEKLFEDAVNHQTMISSATDAQVSSITIGSDSLVFNNEVALNGTNGNGQNAALRVGDGGYVNITAFTNNVGISSFINISESTPSANVGMLLQDSSFSVSVSSITSLQNQYSFSINPHFAQLRHTNGTIAADSLTKFLIHTDSATTINNNNIAFFDLDTLKRGHIPSILLGSASLNFGSTAAGASTDLTITVTGAADGDVVAVGVPNGSTVANGVFSCWISAANTATVRFTNTNLVTALDPASGTFKVKVIKD